MWDWIATQGGMWYHLVYNLMKYWFSFSMWLNLLFTWTPYLLTISNIELKEFINRKETLNHNIIRRHLFHAQFHESHLTVYIPTTIHFNSVTKVQNKKRKILKFSPRLSCPEAEIFEFSKEQKWLWSEQVHISKKKSNFVIFQKIWIRAKRWKRFRIHFNFPSRFGRSG